MNAAATLTIDGVAMQNLVRPASIVECAATVRELAASNTAVFPLGGGTWLGLGRPPARSGVCLSTAGLDRIVDYPAEDLTITVEAGVRLTDLEAALNAKGQTFPLAVRAAEGATLGGLLATAACGPRRFGYGLPRDFVLGLDVTDARGERIHGGGRVVKNVAGYDLPKMHVGGLGTLGVIVEATLKLKPLPERHAWTVAGFESRPDEILAELRRSPLRPTAVELLNPRAVAAFGSQWVLALSFEDCTEAVERQLEIAHALMRNRGSLLDLDPTTANDLWRLPTGWLDSAAGNTTVKAVVRPMDVGKAFDAADEFFPKAAAGAHAGSGVVWIRTDEAAADAFAEGLQDFRRRLAALQGHAIVAECPSAWKSRVSVWGDPRPEYALMERLRHALDPRRIFNPGRFVVD